MPTGELLDVSQKRGRFLTSCELNILNLKINRLWGVGAEITINELFF